MPTKIVCENGNYEEILSRFETQAESLIPEYINTLYNPDDIYKNAASFNGLLHFLYLHMFKPDSPDETPSDHLHRSIINPHDLQLMDMVYAFYVGLCSRFSKFPSVLGMGYMIGVNLRAFMDNETRNARLCRRLKEYNQVFELYLQDRVLSDNSIGAMFLLKSRFAYNDTPTQRIEVSAAAVPVIDKSDILAITDNESDT